MKGRCSTCNTESENLLQMTPTLDPSIRSGYCVKCNKRRLFMADREPAPVARQTDPETSHAAAASVRNPGLDRERVFRVLDQEGPMTDEEILARCHTFYAPTISPSGARTRRAELVKEGRVVDTGAKKRLSTGRMAIIWARRSTDA